MIVLALQLVAFTGPDNQLVYVNPAEVVTTRAPRDEQHFGPGIKCLIHMADGKFVAVIEDCATVNRVLQDDED